MSQTFPPLGSYRATQHVSAGSDRSRTDSRPIRSNPGFIACASSRGIIAALVCSLALILSGCGTNAGSIASTSSSNVSLALSPAAINFGDVTVGKTATTQVTLLNSETTPVSLASVTVAGQAFSVETTANTPITIQPGASYKVSIGFKPNSATVFSGKFTAADSAMNTVAEAPVQGTGQTVSGTSSEATSGLTVDPGSLNFGDITVGQTASLPVKLTATGSAAVTVNSATVAGTGFAVTGATFPLTINPNQSVTLNAQFAPSAAGAATGSLTIDSNASNTPDATVSLSGTGAAAATPPPASQSQLTASPGALTFGDVTTGNSSTLPVTLTASGTEAVTINAAAVSGAGYSVSGASFPLTLNPTQSVKLQVKFSPQHQGEYPGGLTISSDATANPSLAISLQGTGTVTSVSQLSVSTGSLTFGNVTDGSSSTQPVTLTSTGNSPVTIQSASVAGAGFSISGATFPLTLNSHQAVTLQVEFAPSSAGSSTGTLTIASNSATNANAVVELNGTGTAATSPQLSSSAAGLTFGRITDGSSSTQPLTLTSTGTSAVKINAVNVTGADFSVSGASFPLTLNPHQSVTLNVKFAPTASGTTTGALTIDSDSSTNATMNVNLSGIGSPAKTAQLSLSAASLTYGDVTVGSSSMQPLTLTSTGTAAVTIQSATLAGTGFVLSQQNWPLTLNPGQSVTLQVSFEPAVAGTASGTLAIASNSQTNSTATVNLRGTGTVAESPQLSLSTATLGFGNVTEGSTSTIPLTLSSTGTAAVTIQSITEDGAEFSVSPQTLPMTLSPGGSVTLQVQFAPTTSGGASGEITINSDSSTNATAVVALSGSGVATLVPQLAVSPSNLSFGNVTVGSSSSLDVTLSSTGTEPVTVTAATISGSGFTVSGQDFPLTLSPGQTATLNVQFEPSAAGNDRGTLTIQSNSSTGAAATVHLFGAGVVSNAELTVSTTSLSFGSVTIGLPSILPVTLTSSGTAPVTVSSITLNGTGFSLSSGGTTPLTLNPGQTATLQVQFDPLAVLTETGTLVIQSNSVTNATQTVNITGAGIAAALHGVNLSWSIPSSSVTVTGYNVYRAISGSTTFQLLNSSPITGTTYSDNSVGAGLIYTYYVESLDSAGTSSAPSNQLTLTIPSP